MQPTKILRQSKAYDFGDLYDDVRLAGFVFAAVSTDMHGVRLNLVSSPAWAETIESDIGGQLSTDGD